MSSTSPASAPSGTRPRPRTPAGDPRRVRTDFARRDPPRRGSRPPFAIVALGLVAPATSSARARSETSPGDGAHLDARAHTIVSLTFSEHIAAPLGAVRVFDQRGNRVDNGNVTASDATVTAGLNGGLGDGAYVVTWRVISADSHSVRGRVHVRRRKPRRPPAPVSCRRCSIKVRTSAGRSPARSSAGSRTPARCSPPAGRCSSR